MLLWITSLLYCFPTYAFIPEGLESMSLYKGSAKKSHIYRREDSGCDVILDYFTGDKNLFTAGYF